MTTTAEQATLRPLWLLGPNGMPVRANGKPPKEAIAWCREGDPHWHPIATLGVSNTRDETNSAKA